MKAIFVFGHGGAISETGCEMVVAEINVPPGRYTVTATARLSVDQDRACRYFARLTANEGQHVDTVEHDYDSCAGTLQYTSVVRVAQDPNGANQPGNVSGQEKTVGLQVAFDTTTDRTIALRVARLGVVPPVGLYDIGPLYVFSPRLTVQQVDELEVVECWAPWLALSPGQRPPNPALDYLARNGGFPIPTQ